jgi:hypothetical protein
MARTNLEHATTTAGELEALRRDRAILDMVEADYRAKRPDGATLRTMYGGLLDIQTNMNDILAAFIRQLDGQCGTDRPSDRARSRA